jgi:hypothetical protein
MGTTLMLASRRGGGFSKLPGRYLGETSDDIEVVADDLTPPCNDTPESSRRSRSG